jgi:hypothetical protein
MISMKQAVNNAMLFVVELYGKDKLENLLLEEIELSDDESYWFVTIGFNVIEEDLSSGILRSMRTRASTDKGPRIYKQIKIDAETGVPLSLKIRNT